VKSRRSELHALTGGYALDALEPAELASFEHHLDRCGACATEVRGLRETAAQLGIAVSMQPPARLEEQVLAATYRTRQLPPLPAMHSRPAQLRIPLPRLPVAVAAVSAAAAIVLGFFLISTSQQLSTAQAGNRAIAAVLGAPDARLASMRTGDGATVTVIASDAQHDAVVATAGMLPLPGARVYQAWVMDAAGARSAGLLQFAADGGTVPILAAGLQPGDKIGITIEPAGGTTRPTTTPLVTMPVPA
jgi:anti-sigma-K factor RskA